MTKHTSTSPTIYPAADAVPETIVHAILGASDDAPLDARGVEDEPPPAWSAPAIPITAIEDLVEKHRPATLVEALRALGVDVFDPESVEPTTPRFVRPTRHRRGWIVASSPESLAFAAGSALCARAGIRVPMATSRAWFVEVGAELERRIAEGWKVPRTPQELTTAIVERVRSGRGAELAARLILACPEPSQRVARLIRAYRLRLEAARAELDYAERVLDAIATGDVERARALEKDAFEGSTHTHTVKLLHDVDYFTVAVDPEYIGTDHEAPIEDVAESAVRWPHKGEFGEGETRLEYRVLAALAGTHVDELRLDEKEVA